MPCFLHFAPKVIVKAGFTERCRVWFCSKLGDVQSCNQVQSKRPGAKPNPREMCGIPVQRRTEAGEPKEGSLALQSRVTQSR